MGRRLDELVAEALELSKGSRAALAKTLLESLDSPTADEVGEAWLREADRRYAELRAGNARTLSFDEVFARYRDDRNP